MMNGPVVMDYHGGTLYAVPAQHFHHYFASIVHGACYEHPAPPLAIAVELGPSLASEARRWLAELSLRHERLPIMLGLRMRNRFLRRTYRERAEQLKAETGKELYELPADTLKRELNYNEHSLLFLSPTDSIVEAIRCGVELGIPVFGVDLEDMADRLNCPQWHIESASACRSLEDFINRNMAFTNPFHDQEIDMRREIAMAARLKALLARYQRVLFTCGLGHWEKIIKLLNDPSLMPALLPETPEPANNNFERVVVHPSVAAPYLDSLPAVALQYEQSRLLSVRRQQPMARYIDPKRPFAAALVRACRKYFRTGSIGGRDDRLVDRELIQSFTTYLENLTMLNGMEAPGIGTILNAAAEHGLSGKLIDAITAELVSLPWASTEDHPGCKLVSPTIAGVDESSKIIFVNDGKNGKGSYFRTHPDNTEIKYPISYTWPELSKHSVSVREHLHYVWPPYEYYMTGLSVRAISEASLGRAAHTTVPFEGSLLNGIDMKRSVRAFSKGEDEWFVRDSSLSKVPTSDLIRHFPIVWLLDPTVDKGEWQLLIFDGEEMRRYARDENRLQDIMSRNGIYMAATLGFGPIAASPKAAPEGVYHYHFSGLMTWSPPSFNLKQVIRWAELTEYKKALFTGNGMFCSSMEDLRRQYHSSLGIRLDAHHWTTSLIMCAVPYAGEFLTIVMPDGYCIDKEVVSLARKHKVRLNPVSLSRFNSKELQRASLCHMVPSYSGEAGIDIYQKVSDYLNEKQNEYFDLIPKQIRDFAHDRRT